VFCQLAYPAVIQSAFGMFSCQTLLDGATTAFALAPHLDCNSDEAHSVQPIAAASLALWGVGFPFVLGTLIHRLSNSPMYNFSIVAYGYKRSLRYWEAWECLKKFGILLIITFLRATPELAATILLVFLCFTMLVSALSEPSISSLINKSHLACEFLVIIVLLTGLLSTCTLQRTGQEWPEKVDSLSIVVVSYAACLLAGLIAILWLESGLIFCKGGKRQALWDSFVTSHDGVVSTVRRLSNAGVRRLSGFAGFSAVVMQEPATSHAELRNECEADGRAQTCAEQDAR
jgi:hypothetical protein